MRLLIYSLNYTPELTGIGKYTGELGEWFSRRGHDVRVITGIPYYPEWKVSKNYRWWTYKEENILGCTVIRCPVWVPSRPSAVKRILHLVSFALSSMPMAIREAFWKPDIIFVVEPPLFCSPIAWIVSVISRASSWLHIQDFEVDAAFDLGLIKANWLKQLVLLIERGVIQRFDRVSTISNAMIQRLKNKGVSESRRLLFPNWVDTHKIFHITGGNSLRTELGIDNNHIIALYSGNMGEKQGLEIIIDAAKILINEPQLKFVMCGDGAAYNRLRILGQDVSNIQWLNLQPVERLNELLNIADIHLLPQRADAADLVMPSKLTGMLASGRPVVATANPDTEVWQVVQKCGVTVSPGDAKSFADAILLLANDSDKRAKLGCAARQYAEQQFDHDVVLSCFEKELVLLANQK